MLSYIIPYFTGFMPVDQYNDLRRIISKSELTNEQKRACNAVITLCVGLKKLDLLDTVRNEYRKGRAHEEATTRLFIGELLDIAGFGV